MNFSSLAVAKVVWCLKRNSHNSAWWRLMVGVITMHPEHKEDAASSKSRVYSYMIMSCSGRGQAAPNQSEHWLCCDLTHNRQVCNCCCCCCCWVTVVAGTMSMSHTALCSALHSLPLLSTLMMITDHTIHHICAHLAIFVRPLFLCCIEHEIQVKLINGKARSQSIEQIMSMS